MKDYQDWISRVVREHEQHSESKLEFEDLRKIRRQFNMISKCDQQDFDQIYDIINDAASAYRGIIPSDRWHEPYMSMEELKKQIEDGVLFWKYAEGDVIVGVMGSQFKKDVTLIRHAYVRTIKRNTGIGSKLLKHLCELSETPVLIGTWADATWAIDFYQQHGFRLLPVEEKNTLLRKYWQIPERQILKHLSCWRILHGLEHPLSEP